MTVTNMSDERGRGMAGTGQPPAIALRGVRKNFGSVQAVRGIDLDISSGEIVAFLGPNGAGKTSTIDITLGLSQPDAGSVAVYGLHPRQAISRGLVSAVMQTGGLLKDLTVAETVEYTASLFTDTRPVAEVLQRAGITSIADRLVGKCSGGEQQRLDANRGRTVLFATHYLEEADAYADRIILLRHGKVVADGTSSEVKAMAAGRTVRFTMASPDQAALLAIPGAESVEVRGETVLLHASDSDAVARYLLTQTQARDMEITTRGLEDAFIALTSDDADEPSDSAGGQR
jgi:ABC-2 type transport system ATP-binding protein